MILSVVKYGSKILRTKCQNVEEITPEIRELVQNMVETMDAARGIGIAAPQVGSLLRIFVLRNYIELEGGESALSAEYQVYINSKILSCSKETVTETEGCLSIPGIREKVVRPYQIVIEAMDLDGKIFQEELTGYNARVRMHESDHLNGVLFIDRIAKSRRKKIDPILKALEAKLLAEG